MAGEGVAEEVQNLRLEISGLRPLVLEMHGNMPRIAMALETLARVTEKLESNTEDHKRIHFRISDIDARVDKEIAQREDLERRFDRLKEEHLICITSAKVRQTDAQSSLWTRVKAKAAEKAAELVLVAVAGFVVWLVLSHLAAYPVTAPIVGVVGKGG